MPRGERLPEATEAMPKVTIDGHEADLEDGVTIIRAAERLGIEIPHYCWHPGLTIAGNCRMCLVEIEKVPKLQIACNTRITDGMVVHTQNDRVKKAQQSASRKRVKSESRHVRCAGAHPHRLAAHLHGHLGGALDTPRLPSSQLTQLPLYEPEVHPHRLSGSSHKTRTHLPGISNSW